MMVPAEYGAPQTLHSRLYDLACAAPLVVLYGFVVAGQIILVMRRHIALDMPAKDWLGILNELVAPLFFGLQTGLMLFRSLPVRKSAGLLPRAVAIVGANFNFALLLLPEARIGETWNTISAALILAGTAGATVVLIWLGRAFSIFPEARQLIAHGPYRVVRHPLYLAEIVATIGITLRYRQPWAILVALVAIGLQLRRMAFEEDILTDAFPGYAVYARHTARLVPGLY